MSRILKRVTAIPAYLAWSLLLIFVPGTSSAQSPADLPRSPTVSLAVGADADSANGQRLPVPDADAQRRALELVTSVFKDQFDNAGDFGSKQELARKMVEVAAETDDPVERYVLLRVSRDIATGAGDAGTALAAIETMATIYDVDETAMRTSALLQAAKVKLPPSAQAQVVRTLLQAVDQAVAEDDFSSAGRLLPAALPAARRSRVAELTRQVVRRSKQVADLQKRFEEFREARRALQSNPQDADANLIVGQYHCLVKGNWDRGLPYLALSSNAALKAAATAEMATAETAERQVQLGDAWWDLSQAAPPEGDDGLDSRQRYKLRAAHWYGQAVDRLPGGLARLQTEKRLKKIAPNGVTGSTNEKPEPQSTPPAIAPARGALQVLYKCDDRNVTDNQIRLHLKIANSGAQRVALSELTVRYWFTNDGRKPQRHWCDWAQVGAGNVRGSFHRTKKPLKLADTYLEIGFADTAPPISPGGDSGIVQLRLASSDWSAYDESNDYSFDAQHAEFTPAPRVTLYRKGVLVWGTEPSDAGRGRTRPKAN